ncbi:Speckle-type POZ protein-like (HIB homolog 2) (Roadkill homolog 2) [Durusdinium trenchii]
MPIPLSEPDGATSTAGVAGAAPVVSLLSQKVKAGNEHVKGLVANLWRSREDGDFVFNVCGGSLRAHGCILSAASPVFKAMLSSGMSEGLTSSVSVDADPSELLAMLRFIYLGELDATGQQLPGVLELAHKYEVLNLIPPVCEAMIDQLTTDNAVSYVRVLRLLEGVPCESDREETVKESAVQAWMALPGTETLPSVPPANRVTCTGLSQPVQPVEAVLSKEQPALAEPPPTPTGDERVFEASPIAKAFRAVGRKIAGDPELLMATLRSL